MKKQLCLLALLCLTGLFAQENKSLRVVLYFEVDKDTAATKDLVMLLKDVKGAIITGIYGHADSTAGAKYNQKLSERRAKNIATFLMSKGISTASADIKGFGETEPVGSGLTTDRRVVVTYVKNASASTETTPKPKTDNITNQVSTAKVGDKIRLPNMNFESNSDVVLPSSRPVLNELLAIMKRNPKLKIDIQGHICCQTTDPTDVAGRRASAVYSFLVKNGIEKSRLSHKSFASTKPLYKLPEKNEQERIANRRVEIEIIEN